MRLIDADELLKQIDAERKYLIERGQTGAEHILVHNFRDLVLNAPTIEPKKGKWILPNDCVARYLDEWICSNCSHLISHRHNFCPNCGADMREEQEYTMEEYMYGQDMGNPEDGSL